MSYIYSRALVEEYSAANCSDIDASALLSENHTPKPSWWHDKTMEPSRHSRFGMTYAPLTESLGADLLTWFAEDSRAKTLALQETEPDWTAKGQGYGQKWLGLLAKYSPDTHSLKTAQLLLLEDLTEFCVTLPRWGLMLDGELYPQPMLMPTTCEKESGYWPTPTVCGNYNRPGVSETSGMGLASAVRLWATPCARDFRYPGKSRLERTGGKQGECLPQQVGGPLNPNWVEWLMGWPIGQTELKPLETARLVEWQQQHSPCSKVEEIAA